MIAPDPRSIRIQLDLKKGGFHLEVDVELPGKGVTVLFGPSGSGKTSLLRCLAGLERAQKGRIEVLGSCWQDEARNRFLPTWKRPLGYVFQESSLFEHLNVLGNLEYGRRRSGQNPEFLESAIEKLGLGNLLRRSTSQLSGGERQRVAMARALATNPKILLMDEPLASLDQALKDELFPWLEALRRDLDIPILYVTHALDEATHLGDHLLLLNQGKVQACAPFLAAVSHLTHAEQDSEQCTLLEGCIAEQDAAWHLARIRLPLGELWIKDPGRPIGSRIRLRLLARDVSLLTAPPSSTSIQNHLPGRLEDLTPLSHPAECLARIRCGPTLILARITARSAHSLGLQVGQSLWAQVKSVAIL